MTLITKRTFDALYRPEGLLRIRNLDEQSWEPARYYFHLGARREGSAVVDVGQPLTIPAGGFIQVFSNESFTLSRRVLGLIGGCSELFVHDLELIYSPTIDPGYSNVLTLGIRNNASEPKTLDAVSRIGKVVFFDVTDAHLDTHEHLDLVVAQAEEQVRREAEELILEAGIRLRHDEDQLLD